MRTIRIGVAVAAAALASTHTASAGPSAALLVGDGFKDGYNVGIGARGGFTLPMSLYLGGTFVFHVGKSEPTQFGDAKANVFYLGPEVGYDIAAGPLTIRPYLGVGFANVMATTPGYCTGSVCGPAVSSSQGQAVLWPGATLLYPVGNLFVGADLRYVVVLDTEDFNALTFFVTGGTTF